MKILLVSDEESPYLWDHYQPGMLDDIDLIISCGDLKASYLSFLVTMSRAPLLYIHGNHDDKYEQHPPEGCVCIEDRIVKIGKYRIMGLGGCLRYNPRGKNQYTEREMRRRVRKMWWPLMRSHGVDIIVTHAPVRGIGDVETPTHKGFVCFRKLLEKHKPLYWCYGHIHLNYNRRLPRIQQSGQTTLINAFDRHILVLPD